MNKKKLAFLKSESVVGVQFIFSQDITFHSKHWKEKKFIASEKAKYFKYGADKAEEWFSNYEKAKNETWRDAFLKAINEEIKDFSSLQFGDDTNTASYIMTVKTNWIYPGYGGSSSAGREEAKIAATISFAKVSDPAVVIFSTDVPKIWGNYAYGEFGSLIRIEECYKRLAKALSIQFKRIL